jgi:hypothetical protein
MSKTEIITAIRESADRLGHCPTVAELKKNSGIGLRTVRRYFGCYGEAVKEAGFNALGQGYRATVDELFADWARVCRSLAKIPTLGEYREAGRYSVGPLITRFGGWTEVPRGMMQFALEKGLDNDWQDVMDLAKMHEVKLRRGAGNSSAADRKSSAAKKTAGRPVFGSPLTEIGLLHAPTNESGVVFLWGMMARSVGFAVMRMQTEFPDCVAMREVEDGKWQMENVELEFQSRNFLLHGHDANACGVIVCWEHNWPECPEHIEVIELKSELEKLWKKGR